MNPVYLLFNIPYYLGIHFVYKVIQLVIMALPLINVFQFFFSLFKNSNLIFIIWGGVIFLVCISALFLILLFEKYVKIIVMYQMPIFGFIVL